MPALRFCALFGVDLVLSVCVCCSRGLRVSCAWHCGVAGLVLRRTDWVLSIQRYDVVLFLFLFLFLQASLLLAVC